MRRPPSSTRTDTLFPYTTLFVSGRPSARLQRLGADRPVEAAPRLHRTLASHEGAAGNGLLDLVDRPHFSSRPFVGDLRPAEAWRTVITLPWPPAILSPNSRSHWARKLEPKQRYRLDCYMLTKGYLATARHWRPSPDCPLPVKITFCPPDRRHRDDANLIDSIKRDRKRKSL